MSEKDSFEIPIKKNPIFLYAAINIGIVSFMVGLFYFAYQAMKQ